MDVIRSAFESWKAGESRTTLVRLLEASQHLIYGVCHEVLRHREDSEDAAQRVLLDIPKGLDRVADAEHFLRRLRVMAFRTALDTRRDRRRRMGRERKVADMNSTAPLPEEVREAIHEAMSALDEDSRSLVIEHYFEKATLVNSHANCTTCFRVIVHHYWAHLRPGSDGQLVKDRTA